MLDPFTTLEEAGFSQRDASVVVMPDRWSPELIARLDWLRVAELARAIAEDHGCELARSCVLEDGAVLFGMLERPRTAHPQRALVRIASWNEWGATAETVMRFGREVRSAEKTRGILIAPGGFSRAAMMAAQELRIETVDAEGLYKVLMTLQPDRSDFFFAIATAGDFVTPTCPLCLSKLVRFDVSTEEPPPSRIFFQSGLTGEHVSCGILEVAAGCEVTFLHEVRAHEMRIAGQVNGDFVCSGQLILEPGGTLTGTVAARSVDVREGAELRGQFRILEGELQPFVGKTVRWEWRCRNEDGKPDCTSLVFEPHGGME